MGEKTGEALKLQFDKRLRLEFQGARITSDAGLLACRELDGALRLTEEAPAYLRDTRGGRNVQHELVPLLRQSVYSRLAGYEDTNDAERLAQDPAMRVIAGWRGPDKPAASTNSMSRFETEVLTRLENLEGLEQMNAAWVDRAMMRTRHQRIILDMDSSESPVYGEQEGAAYNGHFQSVCYHPLFLFNQFGDCEGANLRPGNVHSAHDWREVLEPIMARYEKAGVWEVAMFIKLEIDWPRHEAAGPCRRCVEACPVDIFRFADGRRPEPSASRASARRLVEGRLEVVADNEDECILCDMCLLQCPTRAITLRKLYGG